MKEVQKTVTDCSKNCDFLPRFMHKFKTTYLRLLEVVITHYIQGKMAVHDND